MVLRHGLVLLFLFAPACGKGLAGNWTPEPAAGCRILHVSFDGASDRALIGRDVGGGDDEHLPFHYVLDGANVTLSGAWDGKDVTWTGRLAGDRLELQGPQGAMTFHRTDTEHDRGH